jgi:hypothetical protein
MSWGGSDWTPRVGDRLTRIREVRRKWWQFWKPRVEEVTENLVVERIYTADR